MKNHTLNLNNFFVFTIGCWDMVEINQWLFPYSIGIDINPDEGDPYIITISYPNIYGIGKMQPQEDRVYVVSTVAPQYFKGKPIIHKITISLLFKAFKSNCLRS